MYLLLKSIYTEQLVNVLWNCGECSAVLLMYIMGGFSSGSIIGFKEMV